MAKPKRAVLSAVQSSASPPDELSETQSLARVAKALGNNNFACELPGGKPVVVELQPQFRNTVFIRRGGYVLVDLASAESRSNNSKVAGEIINVVLDEREWRKQPYWPKQFAKNSLEDDEDDSNVGKLPPSESEDEEA